MTKPIVLSALILAAVQGLAASAALGAESPGALQLAMPRGAPPAPARPLVHEGVLVLPEGAAAVSALDASTGAPLWRFEHDAGAASAPGDGNALLALAEGLLVLATPDARLIALDLATGQPRWQVEAAEASRGLRYETAPLVADGRVFAPIAGCTAEAGPRGCWIAAYDAATGSELWRRPLGAPDAPERAAVRWVAPIYDEETGSLFVALAASGAAGAEAAVTYALDAETGSVLWTRREDPKRAPALDAAAALPATTSAAGGARARF